MFLDLRTSNIFHITHSLLVILQVASAAERININLKNLLLTLNGASGVMTKINISMFSDHEMLEILQMISG